MRRSGLWIACILSLPTSHLSAQDYKVDIGYSSLVQRLGAATPTGAGVLVAQIEFNDFSHGENNYLPIPGELPGKTFEDVSMNGGTSGHATGSVARFFYGDRGIAQGITNVRNYRIDSFPQQGTVGWIAGVGLRTLSNSDPVVQTARIENHSWVASSDNFGAVDTDILRRTDWVAKRDQVMIIVGTNYDENTPPAMPPLLSSAYNVITVGTNEIPRGITQPETSVGPTTGEVAGRSKPDIVVPADAVQRFPSNSTAITSGATGLLIETANGISANARRIETLKSVLLAGATTEEFNVLAQPWTRVHNGTFREPLDRRYGAGELNIDHSHRLLTQPEQTASDNATVTSFGWDFASIAQGQTNRYFIDITDTSTASIAATWLREITATPNGPNPLTLTPSLANIDIRLFAATGFTTGTLLDESVSPIDNVERIVFPGLAAGRYVIEVTSSSPADNYTLAWDFRLSAVPEPSSFVLLGLLGAAGTVYGYRRYTAQRAEAA